MWSYLISSIELFSNHKSFSLGIDTTRNLWLLLHFKDLNIKHKTILYQIDNGVRQRKSTKYPIRKMIKSFSNTAELLEYLSKKPYKIRQLELEFSNGWKIKQLPFIALWFYTNSSEERDNLIDQLISSSGQGPINLSTLKDNYTYSFNSHATLVQVDPNGSQLPDEFWSEERVIKWRKNQHKSYNISSDEDSEFVAF